MLQTSKIEELSRSGFVEPASQGYTTGYMKVEETGSKSSMADKPTNTASAGNRELDQLLVERAQQGDKKAFGMLVEKYHRKLKPSTVCVRV